MATITAAARSQARQAAFDVDELLEAHVRAEAGLGDDRVDELEGDAIGHDGRVAVGNVGERAGVDEGRAAFERLHQVRLDRLAHQHGHRAGDLELLERHRLARVVLGDDHASESLAQILQIARQRKDGHHL